MAQLTSTRLPAGSPECESVGATNEGARAPNDRHPSYKSGSLSAPACGGLPCRGCGHIVSAPLVLPYGVQRRAYASGPLAAALRKERCGAPLRDGRPCVSLLKAHSLESTAPPSAASFTARQADDRKIRAASTGHRPCPASDAQLLRPSYRARRGEYGGGFACGDNCPLLTLSGRSAIRTSLRSTHPLCRFAQ